MEHFGQRVLGLKQGDVGGRCQAQEKWQIPQSQMAHFLATGFGCETEGEACQRGCQGVRGAWVHPQPGFGKTPPHCSHHNERQTIGFRAQKIESMSYGDVNQCSALQCG